MQNGNFNVIISFIIGFLIAYLILKISFLRKISEIKKKSVKKSRDIILGQVSEQITPLLPNFPANHKDAMFLGKGVDYIIFDGLSSGDLKKIIFLEVKKGKSRQNKNEKMIQQCIENKKIEYKIFRI